MEMKARVTAEELAEIAGIKVSTLFKTAKVLREVVRQKTDDDGSLHARVASA